MKCGDVGVGSGSRWRGWLGDASCGWYCGSSWGPWVSRNGVNLGDDVTSFLYPDIAGGVESRGECWEVA